MKNTETKKTQRSQTHHRQTIKSLATHLWPEHRMDLKVRVVLAVASLALAKVVNIFVPFLYKRSVDALSITDAVVLPLGLVIAYGGARVLHQFFNEFRDFIFAKVGQHAQRTIALNTFKHLHALSLRFHLDRQTGGLSRVIARGTAGVQFVLSFVLFNIIPTLVEILMVTIVLLIHFNALFAFVTFITIISYIAFTLLITEWRMKFRQNMNEADSEANSKAIDSLLNYETVKYFGNENHEYHRFDQALAGYEASAIKSQTSLSALNIGQGSIIAIGLAIVMAMAGAGVISGKLTLGDFILVNTFLIQLYLPLNFLGYVYREIKRSLIDMDKMFGLLDVESEIKESANALPLVIGKGDIEFNHVSFGYIHGREVLKDISFRVPAGKTVAIVGPSGSGKSTISKLLYRFYDAESGAVRINGQDIRDITLASLRAEIGIVPQDTVLFNDTIEYNIRYGFTEATRDDILRAANLAKIDELVQSLPQGYQTEVGERGLKLSGGEKQRVAIARMTLKDPGILLFDEATSALDSHTEKEIQASLRQVAQGKTSIIIAHRLSTIVDADQILVLEEGKIVESGRHAELLSLSGVYAALWRKQQEGAETLATA